MERNPTSDKLSRRNLIKSVGASAAVAGGFSGLSVAQAEDTRRRTDPDPVVSFNNDTDFSIVHPEYAWTGLNIYLVQKATFHYYGAFPRPSEGVWAHKIRMAGQGEAGQWSDGYFDDETEDDAELASHLTGHHIDFREYGSDVEIWTPDPQYGGDKIGASPANGEQTDDMEKIRTIIENLANLTNIGDAVSISNIMSELVVSNGSGNSNFDWELDDDGAIEPKTTKADHYLEMEIRAEPGEQVQGILVSGSKLENQISEGNNLVTGAESIFSTPNESPGASAAEVKSAGNEVIASKESNAPDSIDPARYRVIPSLAKIEDPNL